MGSCCSSFKFSEVRFLFSLSSLCVLFPLLSVSLEFNPVLSSGVCAIHIILLYLPRGDVLYDFHIQTMFGPSLPLVDCRGAYVLYILFVFARVWGVYHYLNI